MDLNTLGCNFNNLMRSTMNNSFILNPNNPNRGFVISQRNLEHANNAVRSACVKCKMYKGIALI